MPSKMLKFFARSVRAVWRRSPAWLVETSAFRLLGRYIYDRVTRFDLRVQSHHTKFCRNVPQAEAVRDLIVRDHSGPDLKVASVGCSTGAELYSCLYTLRSSLPDIKVSGVGIDLSHGVVKAAQRADYETSQPASAGVGMFATGGTETDQLSEQQVAEIFETLPDGCLRVREWIRDDTTWLTADATDPGLIDLIGQQDIVLANNFLGPMDDDLVERCVRNLLKLLRPGGFLVVEGIDQKLRARLFPELGLETELERFEEIYNADPSKRNWPWDRWAHEPIDRKRVDWPYWYCSIFKKT